MNNELTKKTALVIIDVQKAWILNNWGKRNNPQAERNLKAIIGFSRENGIEVIHVRHLSYNENSPFREGKESFEFQDIAIPIGNEKIVTKRVNSAFIGTDLDVYCRMKGIKTLFLAGITTDHCVSTSARMAGNLGFENYVVEDACYTFDRIGKFGEVIAAQTVHDVNIASLREEFSKIIGTDEFLKLF